jgi:hypothetical protein
MGDAKLPFFKTGTASASMLVYLRAFAHMKRVGTDWSLLLTRFNPASRP